jgi:hypothetical protein
MALTDEGQALRANNPFPGIFSREERARILGPSMKKRGLEHIIRAAAAITNEKIFVAVGSQAVFVQYRMRPLAKEAHAATAKL